jgi:multiple sugar transport system substrate-binding protein
VRRIRLIPVLAAGFVLATAVAVAAAAPQKTTGPKSSKTHEVVFFSTQLTPVEEAEKVRSVLVRGFPHKVDFIPATSDRVFEDRIMAEVRAGRGKIDLLGALHGSYLSLKDQNALLNLADVARQLKKARIGRNYMTLGKLGTKQQYYIPWMQATYIMVANRSVLPLLPKGADRNRLTYAQLLQWAKNIRQRYGVGRLGFPVSDTGLFHRFLQGHFVPSFTGRNVTKWKSSEAVAGWTYLRNLWKYVHPQSLTYGFMQDPLLNREVLLAWDHVARVKAALEQRPQDFVTFPVPRAAKGRAYMPVLAGLAVPRSAPNPASGKALIRHMLSLSTQARTLAAVGFFPVRAGRLSKSLPAGLLKEASAVNRTLNARDALPSLLPIGLGAEGGNFNRIYRDTFTRIVIRGENIRTVLNDTGNALQAIFQRSGAPCWAPDPPSRGACKVG